MLECCDWRERTGDDRMIIDVDGNGDEVVSRSLVEHQKLDVELSEAQLLGEEEEERVAPLARGVLEVIERLPEPHAVARTVGRRDVASGRMHEATTVV